MEELGRLLHRLLLRYLSRARIQCVSSRDRCHRCESTLQIRHHRSNAAALLSRITTRNIHKLVGRVVYLCWTDDDGRSSMMGPALASMRRCTDSPPPSRCIIGWTGTARLRCSNYRYPMTSLLSPFKVRQRKVLEGCTSADLKNLGVFRGYSCGYKRHSQRDYAHRLHR